ncbi:MAG: GNAT family N-acetyltransferase [Ktedonobacterales bacterium]
MAPISVREVTAENWRDTLRLTVHRDQQRFVADTAPIAAIALAKAYIRPGGLRWVPYAFYAGDTMVGFAAVAYEPHDDGPCWLYHFFIDHRSQRRGFGARALHALIQRITDDDTHPQALHLTVHPENTAAQRLYTGAGFQPTGDALDGEPVYALPLRGKH